MKLFKLRKVFTKAKRQRKKFFFVMSAVIFTLVLYLAGVVFGVDQYLIKTPFEGEVIEQDGRGVSDADVMLQGNKTKTDKNGKFRFEDVNFGTYEIVVDKNGFVRYNEKVKIKRFSNRLKISMKAQEYGEVTIRLKTDRAIDKNISFKINNLPFPVQAMTDEFIVEPGRLLVGKYLLEMSSVDFVDFSEKFNLISGKSELEYQLQPSGEVIAEFRDYLSDEVVEPDLTIITVEGQTQEVPAMENPGKFELSDVEIGKEYNLLVQLSGYLDREVKFVPKQGQNSLGNIFMFVDDSFIYTEKGKIISSSIDGSDRVELYSSPNRCVVVMTRAQYTLISCGSNFLLYKRNGVDYELIREYVITSGQYDINLQNLQMVVLDAEHKSIQQVHSSINTSNLYNHNKEINSLVVDYQGVVYFSDSESVFKLKGQEIEKVIDGKYELVKFLPDNNTILAYGNQSFGQSNIWKIVASTKTATKITFLPNEYKVVNFEAPDKVFYMVKDELFIGSLDQNNFMKIADSIDSYWLSEGSKFVATSDGNTTYLVSRSNYNKKPIFSNE